MEREVELEIFDESSENLHIYSTVDVGHFKRRGNISSY